VKRDGIDTSVIYQLALDVSPSGIIVVEPDGTIAMVNRELERQFGYSRDELIGRPVDMLLPEPVRLALAKLREDHLYSQGPRPTDTIPELQARTKGGGEIDVEVGLSPLPTADGLIVLATVSDVTERRRGDRADAVSVEEQLEFERSIAELSGKFINVPLEQVGETIREGLGRVCTHLRIDRSEFCKFGPDGTVNETVHWSAPDLPATTTNAPDQQRFPWALERVLAGEIVHYSSLDEIPSDTDRESLNSLGQAAVILPLRAGGQVKGAVCFASRGRRTWVAASLHRLSVVATVFAQVVARQEREDAARAAAAEAQRLKDQLQVENVYLRQEARERLGLTRIVGQSAAVRRVLDQIQQVASTDSTVLLLGETGTGKELFATQIHELGPRRQRSMVRVNCAAIPPTLIESELFGREKGAFTGALARQIGRFEMADHSTIFLDEIGDLPLDVQVKLLRVLEERTIERLGSPQPIRVDVRIIAATHRDLERRVAEGAFREDLYYRLNVFPIPVPPLRERAEDIPLLVWRFVEEFSKAFGRRIDSIDKQTFAALAQYSWPGNIRELRNVVERAMIVANGHKLSITPPHSSPAASRRSPKLVDVEKEHIRAVLEATAWRIRGTGGAADRLGLKPTTLETRMAKLGLKRPGHA
jgi:formate hydrogenlyase transcriptional activator